MVIEVEKKFELTRTQIATVLANADYVTERRFTDVYYDTSNYSLTRHDFWLRSRDGCFELKIRINGNKATNGGSIDQHKEIANESEIRRYLHLPNGGELSKDLWKRGYKPFAKIVTTRKVYKEGEFTLSLDVMDFGYQVAEVELLVSDQTDVAQAEQKISHFARRHNLEAASVRGKVVEFLARKNPEHFKILADSGIVA